VYLVFEDRVGARVATHLSSNPNGCRGIEARMLQDRVLDDVAETKVFVDVSKDSLDVAIGTQKEIITLTNVQKGVDSLVKKLSRIDVQITVFESTGGYELLAASLPIVIVTPRQVCNFVKATGILAKTDAINARVITCFAEAVKPEIRPVQRSCGIRAASVFNRVFSHSISFMRLTWLIFRPPYCLRQR